MAAMGSDESDLEGLIGDMLMSDSDEPRRLSPSRHQFLPWWARAALVALWRRAQQRTPLAAHMEVNQEEKQQILGVEVDIPRFDIHKMQFDFSTPKPLAVGYQPFLNVSTPGTQVPGGAGGSPLEGVTGMMIGGSGLSQATPTGAPVPCGHIEEGMNYPGNDIDFVRQVPSAQECCQRCTNYQGCVAWTWGAKREQEYSDICYLKGSKPRKTLFKIKDANFVSGQPLHGDWISNVIEQQPGRSLYCFALALPDSYELGLLGMQYERGASLFACDEYAIYSNQKIEVAPGVLTGIVQSDLKCQKGGEFGTALNTDIFMAVWDKVFADTRFQYHDWTVKVDPDAVFFPFRLRDLVVNHKEYQGGVYLNNCHRGMHGPLEVFSRIAVFVWRERRQECINHFQQECSGPCKWGEDMWLDQCLQFLKVTRQDDWNLLLEEACDPPPNWSTCQSPNKNLVAFHPYKTVESYAQCMNNAFLP
eukprot:CAMPEP_0179347952 /NCGR_PEP_ID=MMETSP0797-20121207/73439_1 /TAXON_ID=47934 /ORGANISM="Dinophysis acuminata, Strain DAEP01" /LENGTH=474 /DNA_ID=CAMNT_0021062717 /DNA_START=25 /DNA_END=1449 /DNA_ORIENTATION=+